MSISKDTPLIMLRGAGDLASGVALRLYRAGFTRLALLECHRPLAVRRSVSFSEAVYEGQCRVEEVEAEALANPCDPAALAAAEACWNHPCPRIPVLADPEGDCIAVWQPQVFIEATLRKTYTGLLPGMAPLVLALGPGHSAPEHAHAIIETQRGHSLGRVITRGTALQNTGIPAPVQGLSTERVLRAPMSGVFRTLHTIGDVVEKGHPVGWLEDAHGEDQCPQARVRAAASGMLRGLLRDGTLVSTGVKLGDIDPRIDADWHTVSDKALAIGGGVLEAVCGWWFAKGTRPRA